MLPAVLVSVPVPTCFFHGGAHRFEVEPHLLQHAHRDPLPEFDQTEQDVLRADIVMMKTVGFLPGQRQHLLRAGVKLFIGSMRGMVRPVSSFRDVEIRRPETGNLRAQKLGAQLVAPGGLERAWAAYWM